MAKPLRVLTWNAGHLGQQQWAELRTWLRTASDQYDVIALQETHWQESTEFDVEGWHCVSSANKGQIEVSCILVQSGPRLTALDEDLASSTLSRADHEILVQVDQSTQNGNSYQAVPQNSASAAAWKLCSDSASEHLAACCNDQARKAEHSSLDSAVILSAQLKAFDMVRRQDLMDTLQVVGWDRVLHCLTGYADDLTVHHTDSQVHMCKMPRSKISIQQPGWQDSQVRSTDSGKAVAEIFQWQAVVT
ncbi:unnamed protein product [Symbiodinium natans]|uniref:Endonuclease/exonuclease/phosphatase domain-containing protein n=1 Tax=Symbiodinium natans TaxID=878477 RepID=A0A812HDJ7_9DINO|nr:unnamed protein product [Symbiodinium natans]